MHKPSVEGERRRIFKQGGEIRKDGRIYAKNKEWPGLAMTRALGDKKAQGVGVTWEPSYFETKIVNCEKIAILSASDGLWDVIPENEI